MNRTFKTLLYVIPFLSGGVHAAEPSVRERHLVVEASLAASQRTRSAGKGVMTVGTVGLVVAAVTAGAGAGIAAKNTAEGLAVAAVTPWGTLAGGALPRARPDDTAGALLTAGLVTGVVSALVLASGAVVVATSSSAKQRQDLEREKLILEWQMALEARDARVAKAALDQPTQPPTLMPQAPAQPHLRGPLYPAQADAPRR